MGKIKGMGGHMDASLIAQAKWYRQFFETKAHHHEAIAREMEESGPAFKRMAQIALAYGNVGDAFAYALRELAGERPENMSAEKHRAIARQLREKGEYHVARFRERLKERGVCNVRL